MIKQIGVFDKVLRETIIGKLRSRTLEKEVNEALINAEIDSLPCPACGSSNVIWEYVRTREKEFIWDIINEPVSIQLPVFEYYCGSSSCLKHGVETISPDIIIERTELSFHYLFKLLYIKKYSSGDNLTDRDSVLYEKLDPESLKKWVTRFNSDFKILKMSFPNVTEDNLLLEKIEMAEAFSEFFKAKKRFFLHKSEIHAIIFSEIDR